MSELKRYQEEREAERLGWYFLIAFVAVLIGVDLVHWDSNFFYKYNYHCYFFGIISSMVYFFRSQVIIQKNLFLKYSLIAGGFLWIFIVKMLLTTFTFQGLFGAAYPLTYLAVLRYIVWAYFPDYPEGGQLPIVVTRTRSGYLWKGKDEGYVPSGQDRKFSMWAETAYYTIMVLVLLFGFLVR